MAKCAAITQAGTACKAMPIDDSGYCYAHHPDTTEERRRYGSIGGSRGGRGRPQHEIRDIKKLLSDLIDQVLAGELETSRATAANQLINSKLRAMELERDVKKVEDHEERIRRIEERARAEGRLAKKGTRGWHRQ